MYANKKAIDRKIDVQTALSFIGAINLEKTIFLA
jgi:hypothetical protein